MIIVGIRGDGLITVIGEAGIMVLSNDEAIELAGKLAVMADDPDLVKVRAFAEEWKKT
jgi:hypothetical protein